MKTPLYLLCILVLFATLRLTAQTPSYREILDNLATAAPAAPIDLPPVFFQNSATTALGALQRGIVLYAAAGRARECDNPNRVPVLIAAAKTRLLHAKNSLHPGHTEAMARCLYYLGLIAEKQEGDQATAASYYQQAGNLTNNPGAHDALGRIQPVRQP